MKVVQLTVRAQVLRAVDRAPEIPATVLARELINEIGEDRLRAFAQEQIDMMKADRVRRSAQAEQVELARIAYRIAERNGVSGAEALAQAKAIIAHRHILDARDRRAHAAGNHIHCLPGDCLQAAAEEKADES